MKRLFPLLPVLLAGSALGANCTIEIQTVSPKANTYTLVLHHDPACEILLDHNATHLSLISKVHEGNTTALPSTDTNATDSRVEKLIALAKSKMGHRYAPAKAGPEHFDCSGFVYYVFTQNGIKIPRTSLTQSQSGDKIDRAHLKRGDMVFFDTHERGHVNHSGIYLGGGKFIHSSSGKAYGVTISDIDHGFYKDKFRWGVRKKSVTK